MYVEFSCFSGTGIMSLAFLHFSGELNVSDFRTSISGKSSETPLKLTCFDKLPLFLGDFGTPWEAVSLKKNI